MIHDVLKGLGCQGTLRRYGRPITILLAGLSPICEITVLPPYCWDFLRVAPESFTCCISEDDVRVPDLAVFNIWVNGRNDPGYLSLR